MSQFCNFGHNGGILIGYRFNERGAFSAYEWTGGPGMPTKLIVRDETTGGHTTNELSLEFLTERIDVRELIRSRVYQEVQDYNRNQGKEFRGLVQPSDAEESLNGFRLRKPRQIDWKKQFDLAVDAFEAGRIVILVDDKQVSTLDDPIDVKASTDIAFLRLTPLVGG